MGARNIENALARNPEVVEWCQRASPRMARARTVGLCTGSFFLAEAGLLNNRRTTMHWSVAALMERRYPYVRVEPDSIFVKDGPIWTSADVIACMDLALAMIEEDLGRDMALSVARNVCSLSPMPPGKTIPATFPRDA